METAGDIVRDALYELIVQSDEQTVEASDLQLGIRYLNRMMASFKEADGIVLGYTLVNSPNDDVTVPDGALEGIIFNLAKRLATPFDVPITPELMDKARSSKASLLDIGFTIPQSHFPSTLPLGSGNEGDAHTYHNQHFYPGCGEELPTCDEDNG